MNSPSKLNYYKPRNVSVKVFLVVEGSHCFFRLEDVHRQRIDMNSFEAALLFHDLCQEYLRSGEPFKVLEPVLKEADDIFFPEGKRRFQAHPFDLQVVWKTSVRVKIEKYRAVVKNSKEFVSFPLYELDEVIWELFTMYYSFDIDDGRKPMYFALVSSIGKYLHEQEKSNVEMKAQVERMKTEKGEKAVKEEKAEIVDEAEVKKRSCAADFRHKQRAQCPVGLRHEVDWEKECVQLPREQVDLDQGTKKDKTCDANSEVMREIQKLQVDLKNVKTEEEKQQLRKQIATEVLKLDLGDNAGSILLC